MKEAGYHRESADISGLGGSLAELSAERIAWAKAAAQRLEAGGFKSSIASTRKNQNAWYLGEHLAFAPHHKAPLRGAPAEEWMRVLSANEPILAEIEQALGLAAEFRDVAPLSQDWPQLSLHREGEKLGDLIVMDEVTAPAQPARIGAPQIMRAAFQAARLPLSEAEALEAGDMVILDRGPWPLLHSEAGGIPVPLNRDGLPLLGFNPDSGKVLALMSNHAPSLNGATSAVPPSDIPSSDTPSFDQPDPGAHAAAQMPPEPGAKTTGSLSVPVAIHLADIAVSQADLDALAQTGTLDLGAVAQGLTAQLSVGGRSIGRGEIVRIADRFTVLLDDTQTTSPETAAHEQQGSARQHSHGAGSEGEHQDPQ